MPHCKATYDNTKNIMTEEQRENYTSEKDSNNCLSDLFVRGLQS